MFSVTHIMLDIDDVFSESQNYFNINTTYMHYSNRFMRRLLGPSIFIAGVNVYRIRVSYRYIQQVGYGEPRKF